MAPPNNTGVVIAPAEIHPVVGLNLDDVLAEPMPAPAPIAAAVNPGLPFHDFVSRLVVLDSVSTQRIKQLYEGFEREAAEMGGPAGRLIRVQIVPSSPSSSISGGSNVHGAPVLASLEHAARLPVVQEVMGVIGQTYNRIKGSNCLIRLYLNSAEIIVDKTARISRPMRQTMGCCLFVPLRLVDIAVLRSMLFVEEKVPAITLPSDQLLENAKQLVRDIRKMKTCAAVARLLQVLLPAQLNRNEGARANPQREELGVVPNVENVNDLQPAQIQENSGQAQPVQNVVNAANVHLVQNENDPQPVQNQIGGAA